MELTMAAQDDATPWDFLPPASGTSNLFPSSGLPLQSLEKPVLHGRGYFSELGIVRRKPSRPDAPPTSSKSCSDKISHNQVSSLLSTPVSLLISPSNLYISSLTLPESQYSEVACTRAFSAEGRMAPLKDKTWEGTGYRFRPFKVLTTKNEFYFSRRQVVPKGGKLVPSNLAASWHPHGEETLIGGVLQGRKQFDPRGASTLCKKRIWKLALEVATIVSSPAMGGALSVHKALTVDGSGGPYAAVKDSDLGAGRIAVKHDIRESALKGWVRNGGDGFMLT
jgi:tRNA-specific adenosine deaminase 1